MNHELNILRLTGADAALADWLPALAALRIRVFRDFPYLYDGTEEYEQQYLETYVNSAESVVVLVLDGDSVVGATTGLPMAAESEAFRRPFEAQGIPAEKVFYCAESVLLPEYRGRGVYRQFFTEREGHAARLGGFELLTFCCVQRPADHALRPADYQPLDPVWRRFGYEPRADLMTHYRWKDIGEEAETDKPMMFWVKPTNPEGRQLT